MAFKVDKIMTESSRSHVNIFPEAYRGAHAGNVSTLWLLRALLIL